MRAAAESFLAKLTAQQREEACLPYDSQDRTSWMYVPGKRPGISWAEMTPAQRDLGRELLKAAVSEAGFAKVESIRLLEDTLREMENNPGRDKEAYWFAFFGPPDSATPWTWRYEGHHLSLSFTVIGGRVQSTTPQFLGTNPAEVKSGPQKGQRVLAKEYDLALELMASLNPTDRAKAIVSPTAPGDILTGNKRTAAIEGRQGLAASKMSASQRSILLDLIGLHAGVQVDAVSKARMNRAAKEELVFAWMGKPERGQPNYYRVQGESFLIEFDNTQNGGNHIHAVWRDLEGDFGGDVLAQHYAHGHAHSHR